ncbi:MAG: AMP-binding protein [Candidatus Nanopelagicales bacterium]
MTAPLHAPLPGTLAVADVTDLVTALHRAAARWPHRPAWTFDPGDTVTFAEVESRSRALAAVLHARGIRAGDRVVVRLDNRIEFPLLWCALMRLGAVMVPMNPRYRADDAGHVVSASLAVAVVTSAGQADVLAGTAVPVHHVEDLVAATESVAAGTDVPGDHVAVPEGTASLQFTSGTTGRPKGCVLSHRYWTELGTGMALEFPYLGEDDVLLTAQAFSYLDPQWNVVAAMLAGAHLVVLDGFHPSTFWSHVREHEVTYFYCLAAMPVLLLAMPPDPQDREHRVRAVQCSAIPPARHAELEQRWGVPWYEAFGMTETGGDLRVTDEDHDELVGTGCLGGPTRHREVRIVSAEDGRPVPRGEHGEIVLRGLGLMDGYDGDEAATAEAFRGGWFHTGDLGRMDDRGRVYLVGRLKDMVRRGGENVAAREVEDVLNHLPDVRLSAVVAVPDEIRGEEVKAHLELESEPATDAELAALLESVAGECERRLARFKVPRYWEVHPTLPRTASERVAKTEITSVPGRTWDRVEERWV